MQSLGSRLRKERESQKLTIRGIADETKITVRYLEAIEADDMSAFPGEFFYRAFVRQYSRHLGADVEEIEKQISLVSSLPSDDQIEAAPTAATSLNLTQDQQIAALRESLKTKPMRPPQEDGMSKAWLAFAFLVIVACAVYFTWRNFTPQADDKVVANSNPAAATVSTAPTPPQASTASVPQEATAPPQTTQTQATQTENPTPEFGKFTLTIRAREMTWIRLTADGTRLHGGTFDSGQERTISASSAELLVGNAGTLDVIYNGKAISYGNRGEVKTLLISPEGWKLKPKSVAEPTSTSGESAVSPGLPTAGSV